MFLNIYYFNSLLAPSVLILVMYYMKFKFLCINLENGICENVKKYILNNSTLSIFKVSKSSTMFRGIFMIIWKEIKLCYIVKILVNREN